MTSFAAPLARILLNTVGTYLVTRGWLDPATGDAIAADPDAVMIATGLVMIGIQYVGWTVAKVRGWAT